MTPEQKLRATEFIQRLDLGATTKERKNGFTLIDRRRQFGFIRFNIAGPNMGKYSAYVLVNEFDDPRKRFVLQKNGGRPHYIFKFSPDNEENARYTVSVLRSAYSA